MHLHAFSVSSPAELSALLAAPAPSGRPYALALLFAAIGHAPEPYQAACRAAGVDLCGCSSGGQILAGELELGGVAGMLFDIPREHYRLFTGTPTAPIPEQAAALGQAARAAFATPEVFVLSGGKDVDGEEIIAHANAAAGAPLRLSGGMAADDFTHTATYSFSDSVLLDPGLVAVIFDGAYVELRCDSTSGWEAMGDVHTITAARGNVLEEINGEPALPYYQRFFGEVSSPEYGDTEVSVASFLYPLKLVRPEGEVLRAPLAGLGESGAIRLAGGVRTGDTFRFSIAPGLHVVEETVDYFTARTQSLPLPAGTVVVSCKGRHMAFGPMLEDELELLHAVYGNVPSAGFLSYGEIGPIAGGASALHNESCCVVAFHARGAKND